MRKVGWRNVAYGLAAATLGLTFAACGDDTVSPDAGVSPDLSATADMTKGPVDMAVGDATEPPSKGQGQAIIADVVGTAYAPLPDMGEQGIPFTHLLATTASFVDNNGHNDYSDFNLDIQGQTITGCVTNRYDLTGAHLPVPDVDVGKVTFDGYLTKRLAPGNPNPPNFFPPPIPDKVNCSLVAAPFPHYACVFGTAGMGGINGAGTTSVPFIPLQKATQWVPLCAALGGGCTDLDCNETGHPGLCEQNLINAGTGGSAININVPGNVTNYAATNSTAASVPAPVFISSIKVGATEVGTTKSLADLDQKLAAAAGQDVTVSWSCDPADKTTTGAGCSALSFFQVVAIVGSTSTNPRSSFSTPAVPKFGSIQCFDRASSTKTTIKAAALAKFLAAGDTALNLTMIRMTLTPKSFAPQIVGHGVGTGTFALVRP